jgi:osmotically-inducible protein OsmY
MELQRDVIDELKWQPSLRNEEIGVAVKEGVVTLSGEVSSYAKKLQAESAAEKVHGVKAVALDLMVKLPTSFVHSDTEIAHAALSALKWDIEVPDEKIKLTVEDGRVVLEGEVEWQYERSAAERAVRYLAGVKSVSNFLTVKPKKVSPYDVTQKIKDAFKRSAEIDSSLINVDSVDGKVVLKGRVRSWAERRDAEGAAWSAPGVTQVDDRLVVSL